MFAKRFFTVLLCFLAAAVVWGSDDKKKAPPKPSGPDKTAVAWKLDNAYVSSFSVESCPASKALAFLQSQKLNSLGVKLVIQIPANQDRSVTINIGRKVTLRNALQEFRKYGYIWRIKPNNKTNIFVTPVGKASEWKTGLGSLRIMDGKPAWLIRSRVQKAAFYNAPFVQVEQFLRKQRYKVSGLGKTPIRITLFAGNVQLKEFLAAVCIASGVDCEVTGQAIRFKKGPAIAYYLHDPKLKDRLVKVNFATTTKSLTLKEFFAKSHPGTALVFLRLRGMNMAHYSGFVPADVSGTTMSNAIGIAEKSLNVKTLYTNGVCVLIPQVAESRKQFAQKMKIQLDKVEFDKVTPAEAVKMFNVMALAADSSGQGIPVICNTKLPVAKVSADLKNVEAGEFLRRFALAQGLYGQMSACGTSFVLVKSGLFGLPDIKITPVSPLVLSQLLSGGDYIDVPLDFQSIEFKNSTVGTILNFVKILSEVRFGVQNIRWIITNRKILEQSCSFMVEKPTIRAILEAVALRAKLSLDMQVDGVVIRE